MLSGLICQRCGQPDVRRAHNQKLCKECARWRVDQEHKAWSKGRPEKVVLREAACIKNGRKISKEGASSLVSYYRDVDLCWSVRVAFPFTYKISKNSLQAVRQNGKGIYLREEARRSRNELIALIRNSFSGKGVRPIQNKVWIDIFVQKTNHKGDAINFVDTVCDAVKKAIDIDDRWFSLRRVDWEIVKENPYIFIGIGQENVPQAQVCRCCGRILGTWNFTKNNGAKSGIGRVCRDCYGFKTTTPEIDLQNEIWSNEPPLDEPSPRESKKATFPLLDGLDMAEN